MPPVTGSMLGMLISIVLLCAANADITQDVYMLICLRHKNCSLAGITLIKLDVSHTILCEIPTTPAGLTTGARIMPSKEAEFANAVREENAEGEAVELGIADAVEEGCEGALEFMLGLTENTANASVREEPQVLEQSTESATLESPGLQILKTPVKVHRQYNFSNPTRQCQIEFLLILIDQSVGAGSVNPTRACQIECCCRIRQFSFIHNPIVWQGNDTPTVTF